MRLDKNWSDGSKVSLSCERTCYYRELLLKGDAVQQILEGYLREYAGLLSKSQIEWELAGRILDNPLGSSIRLPLPDEMLARASGAMLQWVISQQLGYAMGLPGRLAHYPSLTGWQAVLFVRAWALWPENPSLMNDYQELVEWLKPTPKALGWAAVALAGGGKSELAARAACAQLWLRGKLDSPYLIDLIDSMLKHADLQSVALSALQRALIGHGNDYKKVEGLCRLAFHHGYHAEALAAAELLLPQIEKPSKSQEIDAYRIAALARLAAQADDEKLAKRYAQAAIGAYRKQWYQTDASFPYPQDLLPILSRFEYSPLRTHLLTHCDRSVSEVVQLEYLDAQGKWSESLERWQALFEQNPQETAYLISLTEILTLPQARYAKPNLYDKVVSQWRRISELNLGGLLEALAHSALVLLQPPWDDPIQRFRRHLFNASLAQHRLITLAAHTYAKALVKRQVSEQDITFFEQEHFKAVRQVCTYGEFRLFQLLARLLTLERSNSEWEAWCSVWDELMSLSLEDEWILWLIQRFIKIKEQLRLRGNQIIHTNVFHEVELLLEAKGKALGGFWLEAAQMPEEERQLLADRLKPPHALPSLLNLLNHIRRRR